MPVISMFYGIVIMMYFIDNKKHKRPHIHVQYQEQEAVISIPEGDVLEGEIKSNKLKLVQAWIEIHKEDLIADWSLAVRGEHPFKINPLVDFIGQNFDLGSTEIFPGKDNASQKPGGVNG